MREYLRNLRSHKKLTVREVSQKLGISESYYSLIENGFRQKHISVHILNNLSEIFDIPVNALIQQELEYINLKSKTCIK